MTELSLILPCFNEADRLPATLATYLAHLPVDPGAVEVLVVDDGSTDATADVAQGGAASRYPRPGAASQPNHGKGFAVRTGMLAAAGSLLVFTDADGATGQADLKRVVLALAAAPVAIGTRGPDSGAPLARQVASRAFNQALQLLSDLPLHRYPVWPQGLPPRDRPPAVRPRQGERVRLRRRAAPAGQAGPGLPVAEVPVRAQARFGSRVRVLADGRRMLGEVWSVRRDLDADHRSQRRAYA